MSFDDWLKRKLLHEHKVKVEQNPGVIGFYESKPYHNFRYALIYANEEIVFEDEKVEVYTRTYKDTTFVNVLVNDETDFEIDKYHYENIRRYIVEKGLENKDRSIVCICFQHYNQKTVDLARSFCTNTKTSFEQALIYNARLVQMDYYRPVPVFYTKMYQRFMEDLYFDLAFIDKEMD
ncbi:MAG: hypothetical protein IKN46_04795 [Acholeplasmatales bacterium]|nr:hypothetical protein [Acholeplasmatales bacterium]MBR6288669.1 hypothetical protein [Acholeplasmatales bacterium]